MSKARQLMNSFGYLTEAEFDLMQELVRSLPSDPVVANIGAGAGVSCLTMYEARPDIHVVTVDIQDESSPLGCLEGERNALADAPPEFAAKHEQIHGNSQQVGKTIKRDFDMVYIDADHTREGCQADLDAWLLHIKSGGIIAFHDYKPMFSGVMEVVDTSFNYDENVGHADSLIAFKVMS